MILNIMSKTTKQKKLETLYKVIVDKQLNF